MNRLLQRVAVLLIAFTGTVQAQLDIPSDRLNDIYTTVDVQPEFPGGRRELTKYVDGKNHYYPEAARKNNIEGRVVIQFIITEDGTPTDFKVVEGIGFGCDEAAVEAFKKMPKWKPGLVDGRAVKVRVKMGYLYKL